MKGYLSRDVEKIVEINSAIFLLASNITWAK